VSPGSSTCPHNPRPRAWAGPVCLLRTALPADLTAYDSQGSKIGPVQQVYLHDMSGRPDWVTVKTGLFGTKESFVPLAGARSDGQGLHLAYAKPMVKDAPGWTRTNTWNRLRNASCTSTTT
jgi:hypothetical protein